MRFASIVKERSWWFIGAGIVAVLLGTYFMWYFAEISALNSVILSDNQPAEITHTSVTPTVTQEVVLTGRDHIWDMAFLPSSEMLFTERAGTISLMKPDKTVRPLATITDAYAKGEGGLLGITSDPKFTENRYVYTCFNSTGKGKPDVRVARWKLNANLTALEGRTDIITGIEASTDGSNSGCRIAFGTDGYLWIGTGDASLGGAAQDPKKLSGKILRTDRDGKPAKGNLGSAFDARIFSYGHRNTQGIAFFTTPRDGSPGVSTEQGSTVDDELNPLKPGNFGWAPAKGAYSELNVPMTDLSRFPSAIQPIWNSGAPTQTPSGATVIRGTHWKGWNGAVAMAMLKAEHLKILRVTANLKVTKEERIVLASGRLRSVVRSPDGNLYVCTDNGVNDQIIRITPG